MREALSQAGVEVTERDFFADRLTEDEVRALAAESSATAMFSAKSPTVKKLGLDPEALSDDEKLELMAGEPRLIRRPIVVLDGVTYPGASVKLLAGVLGG